MSDTKEFHYFKFEVKDWLSGDIVQESFRMQGVFINICCMFFKNKGQYSIDQLRTDKRFKTESKTIDALIGKFIKIDDNGIISISFLDEQLVKAGVKSETNSENGRKGGLKKKKKDPSQGDFFDETKETESIKKDVVVYPFESPLFMEVWTAWKTYKKKQHKFTYVPIGEQATLNRLVDDADGIESNAIKLILFAMSKTWKGIFHSPDAYRTRPTNNFNNQQNGNSKKQTMGADPSILSKFYDAVESNIHTTES